MTRLSYTGALDHALAPLGFTRNRKDWTRRRGDILDWVNLHQSLIDGSVTVNLFGKDLETERILKGISCEIPIGYLLSGERIGNLVDGRDRWWKNDASGPQEMAHLVVAYGIPWFERVCSLEDQAATWYVRDTTAAWRNPNLPALAVTLFRLGAIEEALALFDQPVPRTAIKANVTRGRCVQRWLQALRQS